MKTTSSTIDGGVADGIWVMASNKGIVSVEYKEPERIKQPYLNDMVTLLDERTNSA